MTSKHTKVMLTSAALLTAVLSTTVQAQSENVGNLDSVKTVTASKDQQPLAQHIED